MSWYLTDHKMSARNNQFTVTTQNQMCCRRAFNRKMVYFYNAGTQTIEILRNEIGAYGSGIPIAAGTDKTWTITIGDDCESEFFCIVGQNTSDLRIEESFEREHLTDGES